MTPDELQVVEADGRVLTTVPGRFAVTFDDTLFEIDPDLRRLFPDDMTAQRSRLVGELLTLVHAAATWRDAGSLDPFVERGRQLGARHAGYGVRATMFDSVETALLAALRECIDPFDDSHEAAWRKLYGLVADTMREGGREGVRKA